MIIKPVKDTGTHRQAIETIANPQPSENVVEVVVTQETTKPTKDLPDVFSLQAKTASAKKSSKKPKPVEDSFEEKQEKAIREYLLGECQFIRSVVQQQILYETGGAYSSGIRLGIQREITNYLLSLGNPIALQILDEYKAQWKQGIY